MSTKFLFLFGFAQGIVLTVVLLIRGRKSYPNKLLGLLTLSLALQLGLTSESSGIIASYPDLRALAWTLPYLFAPLTFLYIESILLKTRSSLVQVLHLAPFILAFVALIPYFNLDHAEKVVFDVSSDAYFLTFAISFEVIRVLQTIFYAFLIFRLIARFKRIAQTETGQINLSWIYQFTYASLFSWLIASLSILAYFTNIELSINPFNLVYLFVLIFIYMLGFKMLLSPIVFGFDIKEISNTESQARYSKSGLKDEMQQSHLNTLSRFLEEEKPYLENDITIGEIASRLDIPKHHLSQVINEQLGQNFFDYINKYRVEHAKKLLSDPQNNHLKILAIGFESGFNSKSTFNSLFKKFTGETPSRYRANLKAK